MWLMVSRGDGTSCLSFSSTHIGDSFLELIDDCLRTIVLTLCAGVGPLVVSYPFDEPCTSTLYIAHMWSYPEWTVNLK